MSTAERQQQASCFALIVSKIQRCKAPSLLWGWRKVTPLLCHVTRISYLTTHVKIKKTEGWHYLWLCKTTPPPPPTPSPHLLTFSNDLLHSDLVPPDSEGSANEISACMAGPGAAASSSSRTGPGAHQLPARIKELPHVVGFSAASKITRRPFPARWVIIIISSSIIIALTISTQVRLIRIKRVRLQPENTQRCLCRLCWWVFRVANFPFARRHKR